MTKVVQLPGTKRETQRHQVRASPQLMNAIRAKRLRDGCEFNESLVPKSHGKQADRIWEAVFDVNNALQAAGHVGLNAHSREAVKAIMEALVKDAKRGAL